MYIHEYIAAHPADQIRVICYTPAPDIVDDHGCLVCGGEGTSTVMFDSTSGGGDIPPDLMVKDIVSISECDGVTELEYYPDEEYVSF